MSLEEKLKTDITKAKKRKYEETMEEYADGDIDEDELEARLEGLVEDGDDFLDYEEPKPSFKERNSELFFQLRQWGQIGLLVGGVAFAVFMVLFFKGAGLLVLMGLVVIAFIYQVNNMMKV